MDNHHEDGRLALWCAAAPDMQRAMVESDPRHYFVPPYVGYLGWVGVRLDRRLAWKKVAEMVEDAYLAVAPRRLIG